VLAAGLLIGAGVGLKLSVSVFALSAGLTLLLVPPAGSSARQRIFAVAAFSGAAGAGWLLVAGFWSWRLYAEFGNPFFPLFNHLFQAPDYPITPSAHTRFLSAWLWSMCGCMSRIVRPTSARPRC
jgi:hypothetical protein